MEVNEVSKLIFMLFICGLFNGAVTTSDYRASNDRTVKV